MSLTEALVERTSPKALHVAARCFLEEGLNADDEFRCVVWLYNASKENFQSECGSLKYSLLQTLSSDNRPYYNQDK